MKTWVRYCNAAKHRGDRLITPILNWRTGMIRRRIYGFVPTNEEIAEGVIADKSIALTTGNVYHVILLLDADEEYCIGCRWLIPPSTSPERSSEIIATEWIVVGNDEERAKLLFNKVCNWPPR